MEKTIFITSFFGFIARNILATEFLKLLKGNQKLRIVILAPEAKREKYAKEFGGENVIVEGVALKTPSFLEKVFTIVFHNLSDTNTWRIHRLISVKRGKRYFSAPIFWVLSKLGHLKSVRSLARSLDYLILPKNRFRILFDKYQPQLLFSTDVFEPNDVDILREARSLRVRAIGMVRSWDNITSKGLNRIIPDHLVVNAQSVKEEAVIYNDVPPEKISIIGIPHYDYYVTEKRMPCEEFFKNLNLDPEKKLIFFAPPADLYAGNDPIAIKVLELLYGLDAQIVVRMPLVGDVNLGSFKPEKNKLAIDIPGSAQDFVNADISRIGDQHLADLLYHSDVVVAFASTLAIDAAAFNKPVVLVGFDGTPRSYLDSLVKYYDYDHQKSLIDSGGLRLAKLSEELTKFIIGYLKNPHLDQAGRRRIVEERCWKLDGESGKRLADLISWLLEK